jgi:hypothetical protein
MDDQGTGREGGGSLYFVKVQGWHPERAWNSYRNRKYLQKTIADYTKLTYHEAKPVATQILECECFELALDRTKSRLGADGFRQLLESYGADAIVLEK